MIERVALSLFSGLSHRPDMCLANGHLFEENRARHGDHILKNRYRSPHCSIVSSSLLALLMIVLGDCIDRKVGLGRHGAAPPPPATDSRGFC